MTGGLLRVGFVGAGGNTRARHIPGLKAIPEVELIGVVNRSPESTARVADEFGITRRYGRWQDLVADDDIDTVVIGTWPDLHCEVTCAALSAGRHVLCEARMSRDAAEARRMVAAAQARPHLTAMLVPSPLALECGPMVSQMLQDGLIGELREVVVIGADDQFHDSTRSLHWRQDASVSGLNVLALGILHETVLRWVPQPERVFAQAQIFATDRPDPRGSGRVPVTVPESLQALVRYPGGAQGIYQISAVALAGPGYQIHLYGSQGTLRIVFGSQEQVFAARVGEGELRPITIPPDKRGRWRVEEEFVAAIRGEERVTLTDFSTGLRYMEFTEAVSRSAAEGIPVSLPPADGSPVASWGFDANG